MEYTFTHTLHTVVLRFSNVTVKDGTYDVDTIRVAVTHRIKDVGVRYLELNYFPTDFLSLLRDDLLQLLPFFGRVN